MMHDDQILETLPEDNAPRRRQLLPKWIIVFCWIFMITSVIAALGIIAGLFGLNFQVGLYGLDTVTPLSLTGVVLTLLFLLKGLVGFGLWTEKDWAIEAGMIDAVIGMTACVFVMVIPFVGTNTGKGFSFRLELILLIPYFLKLKEISPKWKSSAEK